MVTKRNVGNENRMKRLIKTSLIFISLKVVEIGFAILVPYHLGDYVGRVLLEQDFSNVFTTWLFGLITIPMTLCALVLALGICYGIFLAIRPYLRLNWNWAKKLEEATG